jgi:CRISPR-associated protein Cas2
MTIVILERVTPGQRGKLTRWMLEVHPGVFAGTLSARVRDKLWDELCAKCRGHGALLLLTSAPNEQGFVMRCLGDTSRTVVDFDGLQLLRRST